MCSWREGYAAVNNSGWRGHILGVLKRVSITWGPSGDTGVGSAGLEGGSSLQEVGNEGEEFDGLGRKTRFPTHTQLGCGKTVLNRTSSLEVQKALRVPWGRGSSRTLRPKSRSQPGGPKLERKTDLGVGPRENEGGLQGERDGEGTSEGLEGGGAWDTEDQE